MIRFTPTGPLATEADCLAVPVDCAGALNRGLPRAAVAAFPAILGPYARSCARGALRPGLVQFVRTGAAEAPTVIALVALTETPGDACPIERLAEALGKLPEGMRRGGMRSIALPPLGAGPGGLTWPEAREAMVAIFAGTPDLEVIIHGPAPDGWVDPDEWRDGARSAEWDDGARIDADPVLEPALCEAAALAEGDGPEARGGREPVPGASAPEHGDPRTPEEAFESAYGAAVPGLREPRPNASRPDLVQNVSDGRPAGPEPPPPSADWAANAVLESVAREPETDIVPNGGRAVRRADFDPALEGILAVGVVAALRAAVERGLATSAALGLERAPYDGMMSAGYRWEAGDAAPRAVVEVHARALIPSHHQRWEASRLTEAVEAARTDIEAWTAELARQAA